MDEQLHVVICETKNKKSIKRMYKSPDDCRHYLDELCSEVRNDRLGIYFLISYVDAELVIEELAEDGSGEKSQRKYSVISGDVGDVLGFMLELINEKTDGLL